MRTTARMARITVFIPTYNRSGWLPGAIGSVLAQTWPDFRLIVSDNASTDETPKVVAQFDDPRLSYARLEEHIDLFEHFNLCFERATTEYVFTLPDDDRMAPDLLERTVAGLDRNPRAAIAHGQANLVGGDGRLIAERHGMTGRSADAIERGEDFIRLSMGTSHRVHSSTALIRSEAVATTRMDGRDAPITDLGHWLRVALNWDMAFIAHPLVTSHIHAGAETAGVADASGNGYLKTVEGLLKCQEVKVRFIEENFDRLEDASELLRRAQEGLRKDLLIAAGHATLPDRRLTATASTLLNLVRLDRRFLLEPGSWRLLVGSLLGRRAASFVAGLLGRAS